MRFDRVLTNPPFSMPYETKAAQLTRSVSATAFRPEKQEGRPDVPPAHAGLAPPRRHGGHRHAPRRAVPRRRGARDPQKLIEDDLLEAVIGLAPNLFYGTGIPACILVLRARGRQARRAQGKVLFINADRELHEGRAQNYLRPEHIEKIVQTFQHFEAIPGYSSVVTTRAARSRRLQPQHPPLRRQRAAARAARRARPPAGRRAQGRGGEPPAAV